MYLEYRTPVCPLHAQWACIVSGRVYGWTYAFTCDMCPERLSVWGDYTEDSLGIAGWKIGNGSWHMKWRRWRYRRLLSQVRQQLRCRNYQMWIIRYWIRSNFKGFGYWKKPIRRILPNTQSKLTLHQNLQVMKNVSVRKMHNPGKLIAILRNRVCNCY